MSIWTDVGRRIIFLLLIVRRYFFGRIKLAGVPESFEPRRIFIDVFSGY